ncbi:hypothetical protein B0H13DRAFT_2398301 [Mycena leptocephala]|nr:hypothetical protein B0H13DRAFT_2398301 [Mycena leptocephala]
MPEIRRIDSNTTHVSDSEPEREAAREAAQLAKLTPAERPERPRLLRGVDRVHDKGPHSVYCTRVNEGFHQETREIYACLNKRNMTDLDAIREAMALIRMTVNQYDTEISKRIAELAERTAVSPDAIQDVPDVPNEDHWQLGSPQNLVDSRSAMKDATWISDSAIPMHLHSLHVA